MNEFALSSSAFENNTPIPGRFSCNRDNISPPLAWKNSPSATKSFVLICDDPDAPNGTWVHWVIYNLPAQVIALPENVIISQFGGLEGTNSLGAIGYGGPCPPSGTHRYFFTLYAVDVMIDVPLGATKEKVLAALQGHILAQAQLIGLFSH